MSDSSYPSLGEKVFRRTLSNGLTVIVAERRGFTRKTAYFATDFGSIHQDFRLDGRTVHTPEGVAHFLEHKLFDLPGRDVSAEFAALGASVNAFTSYDMTAYYFSCTEHFDDCLSLLLEFVSTPYFTRQSVDKELGIIAQEIGMNDDSPDTRVFENLMGALYRSHPVRRPILGTVESIHRITPELLYLCHRAFYTPANMVLCVVGDVDGPAIAEAAERILGSDLRPAGEKLRPWQETPTACRSRVEDRMEIAMPTFLLGFKADAPGTGEAAVREEFVGDLAAEALFGESSALYLRLYEQGLIDASFGGGYEALDGCAMLTCGGDSDDGETVARAILEQARTLAAEGIPPEDFLRIKRSALGRRMQGLDSFDSTCFRLCAYHFSGFDYCRFPELYRGIEARELLDFLDRVVQEPRSALSRIRPCQT